MKSSMLKIWFSALLLAVTAYGGLWLWRANAGPNKDSYQSQQRPRKVSSKSKLTEFTLKESRGKELHSKDLLGEVWVASVFFTACPSVCLELNKTLAEIQQDARFEEVKFVSITCDPKNDTLSVLSTYANRFGADKDRWFFCTGDLDYIERVGRDILEIAVKGETHYERAVIFDRTGKVRGAFVIANPRLIADRINFDRTLLECLAEPKPGEAESPKTTTPTQAATIDESSEKQEEMP